MDELCEEKLQFFGLILGRGVIGYKIINQTMYILGLAGMNIANKEGTESLRRFCRINGIKKVVCKAKDRFRQILFKKMGFQGEANHMIFEV